MQGNIKVVVRCRPLNDRELARGCVDLVRMENDKTILQNPKSQDDLKAFTFDRSYWSAGDKNDPAYCNQDRIYGDVGKESLDHAFLGFNCCIFAYGQTGSGKSYSMMGYGADKGIIPRTCSELFDRIHASTTHEFQVEVSYMEIYNERVRDLLNPRQKQLKVREHPSLGPYVEDLSRLVVKSFEDIDHLMDEGNKARTVAATNMNETSSRSHAVFTIILTQRLLNSTEKKKSEKVSRFSLVDLAGSERANSTGASGMRLKEGANINRSLTTLGKVIAGLAEQATGKVKKKDAFIPYRDSVLTWLLKDSLGGNSKTTMIAAISPADYDETLSTLRYADQAKKIKTKAVVNEDPNVRMIRDLKSEIQALKQSLLAYVPQAELLNVSSTQAAISTTPGSSSSPAQMLPSKSILITDAKGNAVELTKRQVVDQLKSSEKLLGDINQTWDQRLEQTEKIQQEREKALSELGISVAKHDMGVYAPRSTPHLVNLNEDPLMSECLLYQIKPGTTLVGRLEAAPVSSATTDADDDRRADDKSTANQQQCIRLTGANILDQHCRFENTDGEVTIYPSENGITMVNGIHITEPKLLRSGFRIILGTNHVFRFNHPEDARRERERQQGELQTGSPPTPEPRRFSLQPQSPLPSEHTKGDETDNDQPPPSRRASSTSSIMAMGEGNEEHADWLFARREAVMNYLDQIQQGGQDNNCFEELTNDELDRLFDDVTRLRRIRHRQSSHSGMSQPMSPCSSTSSFSNQRYSTTPSTTSTVLYSLGDTTSVLGIGDDSDSVIDREIIRLAREEMQQQLDQQKIRYEKKLQRLSCLVPPTTLSTSSMLTSPDGPNGTYSEDDKVVLGSVIQHWRDQRYVHLAETLLTNGATIHEANALARQLDKHVVYQLTIIHNTTVAGSSWEDDTQAARLDRVLVMARKPCVGVRVVDTKHQSTYLWSLDRLKTRLRHMQGTHFVTDKEEHLLTMPDSDPDSSPARLPSPGDLFYDSHPPRFSLIGLSRMKLRHLTVHVPMQCELDVFCQRTCTVVGKLSVLIAPIARSKPRPYPSSSVPMEKRESAMSSSTASTTFSDLEASIMSSSHPQQQLHDQHDALQVGQHVVFDVRILSLTGISEHEFTNVHGQFRLSSFGRSFGGSQDQVFATPAVEGFGNAPIDFDYSKTFSMIVTHDMLDAIRHDDLLLEIYGQPTTPYITSFREEPCASHQLPLVEKKHNVYVWVQICELARQSGEYTPVPVKPRKRTDSDHVSMKPRYPQTLFVLRQGQQRRIKLAIRHDWVHDQTDDRVSDGLVLWIGNVRTMQEDDDSLPMPFSPSSQDVSLPLTVTNRTKYTLEMEAAWDSSLHNSALLNRVIDNENATVVATLKWIFRGATFQMDVGVRVMGDSISNNGASNGLVKRASLLRQLFTPSTSTSSAESSENENAGARRRFKKRKTSVATIFRVWERPRRLSSYHVHNHQDEVHHRWQQQQLDKIRLYDTARRSMLTKLEVSHTRYTLALLELLQNRHLSMDQLLKKEDIVSDNTLRTIVHRWVETKHRLQRSGLQVINDFGNTSESNLADDIPLFDVHEISLTDDLTHQEDMLMFQHYGHLKIRKEDEADWQDRWVLLKRPYVLVYMDERETNEVDILNAQAVRVSPPASDVGSNTFTIFTTTGNYLCQAKDEETMKEWLGVMI
ncbi:kinesin-domain-containing protein [Hesseltinella vesiculosa]|uniref:Kinesin-domain-containing protein n=1 Tax=Hesseltinella vesiculosa TaxID=101127 RepID=A0A1X2GYC3_9FUNG|nr:kinesin-domain-containing protein [Hesseltinella vesiculosa]